MTKGATYVAMEGPQFSSRAESLLYRQWGADVIGMTAMPEAKLAREAELCYASVAMVTDFDCWHPEHDAVVQRRHRCVPQERHADDDLAQLRFEEASLHQMHVAVDRERDPLDPADEDVLAPLRRAKERLVDDLRRGEGMTVRVARDSGHHAHRLRGGGADRRKRPRHR